MNLKDLLSKEWFRLVGVLLIGITLGAIFNPTKHIEERLTQKHQQEIATLREEHSKESQQLVEQYATSLKENRELYVTYESKVAKLTDEVKTLKAKQKTETYRLVKPDGTIEERTFSESEVDQSSRVVTQIQQEFKIKIDRYRDWETLDS